MAGRYYAREVRGLTSEWVGPSPERLGIPAQPFSMMLVACPGAVLSKAKNEAW